MNSIQKVLGLTLMSALIFSCSNNDDLGSATNPNPEVSADATHVSFSIHVPGLSSANTRATSGWVGRDAIQVVDLFLVNTSTGNVDYRRISDEELTISGSNLIPKDAIEVKSGEEVKSYVIVNGPESLINELKGLNALSLDKAFQTGSYNSFLAGVNEVSGAYKDVVTMTNQTVPAPITIAPGITADEALKGTNQIKVNAARVATRGIVTLANNDLKKTVSLEITEDELVEVAITELYYAVGQGNLSYNLMQNANKITPSYEWKPVSFDSWSTNAKNRYSSMTDLLEVLVADQAIETTLLKEKGAAFVLPVTHAEGDYVKGNTTYFDVQVKFMPTELSGTSQPDGNAHYGKIDKKFYNNLIDAEKNNGLYVITYVDYVMHYIVWMNPDKVEGKVVNSPTYRNTAYRANISSFKKMGYPINPLDPTKPIDPTDPTNPVDPGEPLDPENTFLSVKIDIANWDIVDNDVEL